ncbi:protein sidekick-1-like [Actinia tenebrosa]|uniref:Protein sidekick-1-like n=1 Tax=Actinia tenebrosa TaxID=6105 RepID=A0A6P8J4I6_ACTTE|nr:protein sidekick-1-like [Actinia tenebrosa]
MAFKFRIMFIWGILQIMFVVSSYQMTEKVLPSPPRHLYTTSYEFNMFLHWTSANSTGGILTYYKVQIHCTDPPNCSLERRDKGGVYYAPGFLPDCDSLKHVDGMNYSCSLLSAALFNTYIATVYAINRFGNSSASISFFRPSPIYPLTTPAQPIKFNATEFQQGSVRLSWKDQAQTGNLGLIHYRIGYREEGSNINMTYLKDQTDKDTTAVINNLNPYSKYCFNVKKQFRSGNISSPLSTPAVICLHTKDAAPSEPPQDMTCLELMKDKLTNVSTVLVSWKPPSKKHQNGQLANYRIFYATSGPINKSTVIVNASQTNINLTIPKPHKTIQIYSKVCNKHGSCSGISETCYINGQPDSTMTKLSGANYKMIVGVTIGASVCIVIIIVVVYRLSCRKKKTTQRDIFNDIPVEEDELIYHDLYDEPGNNEEEHEYDKPNI